MVCDEISISPRCLANIENKGQHPRLQIFYELVARYNISVDQVLFPDKEAEKSTQRRQFDTFLNDMSDAGLRIVTATAGKHPGRFPAVTYGEKNRAFSALFVTVFRKQMDMKKRHSLFA